MSGAHLCSSSCAKHRGDFIWDHAASPLTGSSSNCQPRVCKGTSEHAKVQFGFKDVHRPACCAQSIDDSAYVFSAAAYKGTYKRISQKMPSAVPACAARECMRMRHASARG
eukprot:5400085-Pleurochrysis_carterae.AAC.3